MSKQRGRPKLPEGESKELVITLRVQPHERAKIAQAADAAGKNISDWIRDRLLESSMHCEWRAANGCQMVVHAPAGLSNEEYRQLYAVLRITTEEAAKRAGEKSQ